MKINICNIFVAHLRTLVSAKTKKISYFDLFIFYAAPVLISLTIVEFIDTFGSDVFAVTISVFAIFAALLLNVQVAMFNIVQKEPEWSSDKILRSRQECKVKMRLELLRELNANISYLVSISCFIITIMMIFYAFELNGYVETFTTIVVYVHFLATLLMVIKRYFILFDEEYKV